MQMRIVVCANALQLFLNFLEFTGMTCPLNQIQNLIYGLAPVEMLEIQVKFMPGAPGMNFSRTPLESDFPRNYVGGLRCSPAASGRFAPGRLSGLKTNAGLNILGEPSR